MLYVIRREGQLLAWQSLLLSPHCRNVAAMFNYSVCAAAKHIVGGLTKRASVVRWQAWQCDPLTNQPSTNLPSPNFTRKAKIRIAVQHRISFLSYLETSASDIPFLDLM